MKVTVYSRSGKVVRETYCERVDPQGGDFRIVVVKQSIDPMLTVKCEDWFVTNLPMVVEGDGWGGREPDESDETCVVMLMDDHGKVVREWKQAQVMGYLKGVVEFRSGGEWYHVCGDIVLGKA